MAWIESVLHLDLSDPLNLIPFLIVLDIALFMIALFLDQPSR